MSIPDWWEALLLALAAWRTWQLLAYDDITERPRRYVTRLPRDWEEGKRIPPEYRDSLAGFIQCPYCSGLHLSLGVYLLWLWFPTETLSLSTVLALNAGVIAGHKVLSE